MSSVVESGDTLGGNCIGCNHRTGVAHDLTCRRRSIGAARPHHVFAARTLAKELGYVELAALVETLASEEAIVAHPKAA